MASEVSICNQAISWLRGNRITSLSDGTAEANLCKDNYASLRDAVLEEAEWSFAIKRYILTPVVDGIVWGKDNSFLIPSEVIRIVAIKGTGDDNYPDLDGWVREGENIGADVETIYVRAVVRVTDPGKFSEGFVQALAARIAADICIPLTQSRSLQSDMWKLYSKKVGSANNLDGMQGKSRKIRNRDLTGNVR